MWKERARAFALCLLLLLLLPTMAPGQGVRWESTGKVEFGGALGLIARIVGGGDARFTYVPTD